MSIQEHLNKIRNAVYGHEVRESIAKGIETAYDDASENGNANMEVNIARGTHPNLRSRLDEVDDKQQQTTTQLAQKASKQEVEVERQRINTLSQLEEGSTTGDAELIDARVGADGVTYDNVGGAIRTQFDNINNDIFNVNNDIFNINTDIFSVKKDVVNGLTGNEFAWEYGGIVEGVNDDGKGRIRTRYIELDAGTVIKSSDPSKYHISVSIYNTNKEFISTSPWLINSQFETVEHGYVRIAMRASHDTELSTEEVKVMPQHCLLQFNENTLSKLKDDIFNVKKDVVYGLTGNEFAWEYGGIVEGVNDDGKGRIRTGYIEVDGGTVIKSGEPSNYHISVSSYNTNKEFISTSPWLINSQFETVEHGYVRIAMRAAHDTGLSTEEVKVMPQHCLLQFNENVVSKLNSRINDIANPSIDAIPEYWKEEIDTKVKTIQEHQYNADRNCFSMGFITDMHYPLNAMKSPLLLANIMRRCDINLVVNGGDDIEHANTRQDALAYHRVITNGFSEVGILEKTLRLVGNHDDNTDSGLGGFNGPAPKKHAVLPNMSYSERYRYTESVANINMSPEGLYGYFDDKFQKVRVIGLNSNDGLHTYDENDNVLTSQYQPASYRQPQIDWLINTALEVPDSTWSVIMCSHIPPNDMTVWRPINNDIVVGVVKAFKDKTSFSKTNTNADANYNVSVSVDFSSKGGDVMCWLSGHQHHDRITTIDGNIPLVITGDDDYVRGADGLTRELGTPTEQLFDILTFDKKNRTCHITRVGAGESRSFTY